MKKFLTLLLISFISLSVHSQFIKSIELNAGINHLSTPVHNIPFTLNDPLIGLYDFNYKTKIDFSSSLYFNLMDKNNIRIYSGLSYNKTALLQEYYDENNNLSQENLIRINFISIAGLVELYYPDWLIQPSLRIGPRIDYLYIPSNDYNLTNKINFGFTSVLCIKYHLVKSIFLNSEFTYNYYYLNENIKQPGYDIIYEMNKNFALSLGIEYRFD